MTPNQIKLNNNYSFNDISSFFFVDTLAELACSKSPVKARSSDNTPMGERKNWVSVVLRM